MYSAGVQELFAPSNVLHQVSYIHLIAVSKNMVVCMCVCKYGPPNACMYVCMYVYEYLSRYFLFLVIVVFRNRRESFRRFESDEQRSEVMAEYTEVDSLYVCMYICMYMIALYCMYCICAYLRVQINLKVSL